MANEIEKAMIIEFSALLHVESQQIRARLRPHVRIKPMVGDVFAYDGLGDVEASEISGRVQPVTFDDIEHLRRKISRRRFAVTLPIDDMDKLGVLTEPQSEYAAACIKAMERVFDRVGFDAAFADVDTGRDFETPVTYANDGGFTVTATGGLIYDNLLTIQQNWIDADVGNDVEESMVFCITGSEHTALMKETELISGDFSRHFDVDKGKMTQAAGLQLIKFAANARQPVISTVSGVRACLAMTTRGLCYGLSKEMTIKVQERPDLHNVVQVKITGILGAVRTEGPLIQKVNTTV